MRRSKDVLTKNGFTWRKNQFGLSFLDTTGITFWDATSLLNEMEVSAGKESKADVIAPELKYGWDNIYQHDAQKYVGFLETCLGADWPSVIPNVLASFLVQDFNWADIDSRYSNNLSLVVNSESASTCIWRRELDDRQFSLLNLGIFVFAGG